MSQSSSQFSAEFPCPSVRSSSTPLLNRDEARLLLERSQQRWSQTHDQLSNAIRERTTSPMSPVDMRQKDTEIAELKRELARIQVQMDQQGQQLQFAEATIRQQQATIRNQSKAIENPRPGREVSTVPPQQHNRQMAHGNMQNHYGPAPVYGFQRQDVQQRQQPPMRSVYGPVPPTHTNPAFSSASLESADIFQSNSTGHTPQSAAKRGGSRHHAYGSLDMLQASAPQSPVPSQGGMPASNMLFPYHWQSTQHHGPQPMQPQATAGGSIYHHQPSSSTHSYASPASVETNPYPETAIQPLSTPLVASLSGGYDTRIKATFQKVFDMVQQYALNYVRNLEGADVFALPQEMKNRLLDAAHITTGSNFLSDHQVRHLLVAKIIAQWISKHILKHNALNGLDPKIDNDIHAIRETIYESTPAQVRRYNLNAIANKTLKLCARPDFGAFIEHLSNQHVDQLLNLVGPILHQQSIMERSDLIFLLQEAYRLTGLVYSSGDEISYEFPSHGDRFDPNTMINIDPQLRYHSVADLMRIRAFVSLGTTPIVRIRKVTEQGEVSVQVLVPSKVLLKIGVQGCSQRVGGRY